MTEDSGNSKLSVETEQLSPARRAIPRIAQVLGIPRITPTSTRAPGGERLSWWGENFVQDDPPSPDAAPPAFPTRLLIALGIGLLSGAFCGLMATRKGAVPDFLYPLTAARLFLQHANPYVEMSGTVGAPEPFNEPLFYPFTTILAVMPFARLSIPVACGLFFGISAALLAFLITKDGLWRLHVFAGASFVTAAALGQFAPLLMVMAFAPRAGFLAAVKPNLGLALFVRRPTVATILGCLVFGAIAIVLLPSWPAHWLNSLRRGGTGARVHVMPLLQMGGILLALAALAWRRPAGRLLLAMSLIPQQLFFYDQLPLWLIPRTRKQSILLTACSQLAMVLWYLMREGGDSAVRSAYPYVIALLYLPALAILLRPALTVPSSSSGSVFNERALSKELRVLQS